MDKKQPTYTQAIEEIEEILEKFNDAQMNVDELGAQVKRASELIKLCREKLRKAETEVSEALKEE
jgi:exodeoxyribonuclease VII small subunit